MTRIRSGFGRLPFRCTGLTIGLLVVRFAHAQVRLNFTNADVNLAAKAVGAATGTTIIVDPRVKGQISDDAERWLAAGATSLEEVLRVTGGH